VAVGLLALERELRAAAEVVPALGQNRLRAVLRRLDQPPVLGLGLRDHLSILPMPKRRSRIPTTTLRRKRGFWVCGLISRARSVY
jgi:hypothetical protein